MAGGCREVILKRHIFTLSHYIVFVALHFTPVTRSLGRVSRLAIFLVTHNMFDRGANSKWRVVAGKTRIGKGTRNLLGKLRSNNGPVRQVRLASYDESCKKARQGMR